MFINQLKSSLTAPTLSSKRTSEDTSQTKSVIPMEMYCNYEGFAQKKGSWFVAHLSIWFHFKVIFLHKRNRRFPKVIGHVINSKTFLPFKDELPDECCVSQTAELMKLLYFDLQAEPL